MRISAHFKLLFIGDSITDAGRNKPAPAEGLGDPMGRGFVTMVDALSARLWNRMEQELAAVSSDRVSFVADRLRRFALKEATVATTSRSWTMAEVMIGLR
jgi:hypothetical protein